MDTRHPHPLLPEAEVRALPAVERRRFVPVPESDVERVRARSPAERADYLAANPSDALRLRRAQERRRRKAEERLRRELQRTTPSLGNRRPDRRAPALRGAEARLRTERPT